MTPLLYDSTALTTVCVQRSKAGTATAVRYMCRTERFRANVALTSFSKYAVYASSSLQFIRSSRTQSALNVTKPVLKKQLPHQAVCFRWGLAGVDNFRRRRGTSQNINQSACAAVTPTVSKTVPIVSSEFLSTLTASHLAATAFLAAGVLGCCCRPLCRRWCQMPNVKYLWRS